MNNQEEKKEKEDFPLLVVGPKMVMTFTPILILFGILNSIYYPNFQIPIKFYWMDMIGLILIVFGLLIFIYSERIINKAYNTSELMISKIYSYVRHSMYASWGLGTLPGILCFFNSWFLFLLLPIYYLIVRICIRKEEKFMLKKFGKEYTTYRNEVNAFFPKLKKYKPE